MTAPQPGEPTWQTNDTVNVERGDAEQLTEHTDRPVAVLWLIDPEARRGWREYYVKRETPEPKPGSFGFRRAKH